MPSRPTGGIRHDWNEDPPFTCAIPGFQEAAVSIVLLSKYGVQHLSLSQSQLLFGLLNTIRGLDDRPLMLVLAEIVATKGDMRTRVNPKYRFDERMHDLTQCLLLDGYIVQDTKLAQIDPSIADAAPLEDDLIVALQNSGSPRSQEIIAKIGDSAQAFRATPPDYNAALVNARVALETLAADVAADVASRAPVLATYNSSKWGEVLAFLRTSGKVTSQERKRAWRVYSDSEPGRPSPRRRSRGSDDPPWPLLRAQHVLVPAQKPSRVQVRLRA